MARPDLILSLNGVAHMIERRVQGFQIRPRANTCCADIGGRVDEHFELCFRRCSYPAPLGFVKQSMDKSISSIDDVDHELLHLFVVQPRDLRPRDRTIRTIHQDIRIVTGSRARRNARVQIPYGPETRSR
jgi:hypothetical protein